MSRHYTKKERRIDIEFRPSHKATAHGGQFGINGLAHEFGLWDRIKKDQRLDPRTHTGKGFDPCVYVAAFLFSFTSGGDSLADAGRLEEKGVSGVIQLLLKCFPFLPHLSPQAINRLHCVIHTGF